MAATTSTNKTAPFPAPPSLTGTPNETAVGEQLPEPRSSRKNQPQTMRQKIFETFEDPGFSALAKWYSIMMMILIVLATTCFVLESEATLETGTLYGTNALVIFQNIELVSVMAFTFEYLIRFLCSPCERWGAIRFVFKFENVIDLLAILPFWIAVVIEAAAAAPSEGGNSGLGFVRVIRLVRVFRVFKFGKYSTGMQMFSGAIAKSTQPLSILLFTLILAVIILSSIMFIAESDVANPNAAGYDPALLNFAGRDSEGHLHCYGTIPRTFWWAVVTMTTVGYGDCFPVTVSGKLLAMATMVSGVLILALPITVVGSNFQKMVEMHEDDSSVLRDFDSSEDGLIDEGELREYLMSKRKDKQLRHDVELNPKILMDRYDTQGNGKLSAFDFRALKSYILDPDAADPQASARLMLKRSTEQAHSLKILSEKMARIERLLEVIAGPAGCAHAGSNGLLPQTASSDPHPITVGGSSPMDVVVVPPVRSSDDAPPSPPPKEL